VFNRVNAYRDKKLSVMFVRFSCAMQRLLHLAQKLRRALPQ
jgi:hypothetical protein